MPESTKHIGEILKKARLNKGLTQRALSEKTKISQNHISKIENGGIDLQTSTLVELSRVLQLELMLVPTNLVPTFQALLSDDKKDNTKQTPMYELDQETGKDG